MRSILTDIFSFFTKIKGMVAGAHYISVFNVPLLAKQSVLRHSLLSGDVPKPRRNKCMMRISLKWRGNAKA